MDRTITSDKERVSRAEKNKNGKQWFKDKADLLDGRHNTNYLGYGGVSEYRRKKVNYDLFNNILNLEDFEYVCQPFGAEAGELPAKMVNRDIVSGKVKALLGMEMKRAFPYSVLATNSEATTRKEQEEFGRIKQFVINSIVEPIKQEIELKYQQQLQGDLTEDQKAQIQQQIKQELEAATPPQIREYMQREHQDPAEVLGQQLLNFLIKKLDVKRKFSKGFKHGLISGEEVFYVGEMNDHPFMAEVNPIRFGYDKSPDEEFIENGEWAIAEYRLVPSEVVKFFGKQLKPREIDKIYENYAYYTDQSVYEELFTFREDTRVTESNTIRVLHCTWKSLRKIKFLTYLDKNGKQQEMIVDESYKLNREAGDISIVSEWMPEVYETWKIGPDVYVNMRAIPGQFKDLDNLHECKLPYYGVAYDNLNSETTSLVDRMKVYQYYYNIVMYRLELLLASDKGKKVLMNINAIPDSAGIDIEKWQYFFESTPFMWYDPNEEGTEYSDANTIAKQIDLSLVSDIAKYIDLANYLKAECGKSVGITEQVEGQIGPNEAVTNTRQNITQSSHILEPYFDLHNHVKRNVLQALLEQAKVTYSRTQPEVLSYVLDDLSQEVIKMDISLLENSTLGIFIADSAKADEIKNMIQQLAHAALQNQKVEFSDVISVVKSESIPEAEEKLKVAEDNRRKFESSQTDKTIQAQAEQAEKMRQFEREKHQMEMEKIQLKEEERRKTEIIKASFMGASFNPDQDADNDGINDFLEVASKNADLQVKIGKQKLDEEKFRYQKEKDAKDQKLKEKELELKKKQGNTKK